LWTDGTTEKIALKMQRQQGEAQALVESLKLQDSGERQRQEDADEKGAGEFQQTSQMGSHEGDTIVHMPGAEQRDAELPTPASGADAVGSKAEYVIDLNCS
jgi:hypothetical protein